jgi:hypothetical protein
MKIFACWAPTLRIYSLEGIFGFRHCRDLAIGARLACNFTPGQIFFGLNRVAASSSQSCVATNQRGDKACFSQDFYEERGPQ